ncbi:MAG: T9SS type A sorting domain-containing protein [Flavobacteriales bacterium]|nr:T9SS type A sorting domain-containing protein [Flavobacteriales bacterium]
MTRPIPILLALLIPFSLLSQVSFKKAKSLINPETEFQNAVYGDVDDDGDNDFISSAYSFENGGIYLHLNDGFGNFDEPIVIDEEHSAYVMYLSDIDGDSQTDLLCISNNEIWMYRADGTGFGDYESIYALLNGRAVYAADTDSDTDNDILFCEGSQDRFGLLVNDGSGNFSFHSYISTNAVDANDVVAADLDGDSDLDLVVSCLNTTDVLWFENHGANSFGPQVQLTTDLNGSMAVIAVDLDGDTLKDIVSCAFGSDDLVWFKNLGSGNFSTQITISDQLDGAHDVCAGDIDADGDLDLLCGASTEDRLTLFYNNGSGSFSENELYEFVNNVQEVMLTQVDEDDTPDIVSLSRSDNRLIWIDGDAPLSSDANYIARVASYSNDVYPVDIDSDGDMDIIGCSSGDDKLALYRNEGFGEFAPQIIIDDNADGCSDVKAGFIDDDDLLDLLVCSSFDSTLSWYSQNGDGSFSSRNVLFSNFDQLRACELADLDNDGDLDAISAARFDAEIAYFINDGDGNFGPKVSLSTSISGASNVHCSDLDDDGKIDILAAEEFGDKLVWFRNLGSLSFTADQTLLYPLNGARDMTVLDIDGDGDMDVAGVGIYEQRLKFVLQDSSGFGPVQEAPAKIYLPFSIVSGDMDKDGDDDVVISSTNENKIVWYENDPDSAGFINKKQVKQIYERPYDSGVADFDGDGDLDVVAAYLHTVSVFSNKLPVDCSVFDTAPVDLTKSFNPVNGVYDRVQLKWYKDSPQVRYSPTDNAACDIEFWAVRDNTTGEPIVDAPHTLLSKKKKVGQEFFKWPVKYIRPDVMPNTKYRWKVRCYCESGAGQVSPWSSTKIFNTPAFDPETGIFIPDLPKSQSERMEGISLYPNPSSGMVFIDKKGKESSQMHIQVLDLSGRIINESLSKESLEKVDLSNLPKGIYSLRIRNEGQVHTERLVLY